jgi:hypothetical protein
MININEIKQFIDFVSNKEQSGTAYSIPQFNIACQAANIDLFKLRYGLPEEYSPGMPLPRQAYEVTQKMKDDLRSCKEIVNISVSNGIMTLPSDYVHKTALTYIKVTNSDCGEDPIVKRKGIQFMDDDKFDIRCDSSIKTPTQDFPIANMLKDSIRIEPKSIKSVEFSYLRIPKNPTWGYTNNNGVEQYDPITSVDFEWNQILFTDVAKIVLSYLSINLRDTDLYSAIEQYKNTGK